MLMTDDNFCIPGSLYKQIEVLETCFLHLMFQNMVDRIYIAALYDTVSTYGGSCCGATPSQTIYMYICRTLPCILNAN